MASRLYIEDVPLHGSPRLLQVPPRAPVKPVALPAWAAASLPAPDEPSAAAGLSPGAVSGAPASLLRRPPPAASPLRGRARQCGANGRGTARGARSPAQARLRLRHPEERHQIRQVGRCE